MTPLEIEIVLHYGTRANEYRDGDFSAPAVRETIDSFCGDLGLLEKNTRPSQMATYQLTDRAAFYLCELLKVPLPVQVWQMPDNAGDKPTPPTTVNRYCRAGMCVPSDTKHEPWCTAHRQPPNAMYTAKPAV